jgi:histidinol-phosphate aminotransferase
MNPLALLREDLRDFAGYRSARSEPACAGIRLNANESPWPNLAMGAEEVRCYPEPQPASLRWALAALYGCDPDQVLAGRGSDEAIDLLVRAFCVPGRDAVLVTPPVFGMYAACARLHGARLLEVPLVDAEDDFRVDLDAVLRVARDCGARLVFLCSPGNPAGGVLSHASVLALARALEGSALVVVDEAYVEYAGTASLVGCLDQQQNLAVLRTLSKAHALAGARIGCLLADERVVAALRRCQAPYPIPVPSLAIALQALSPPALARTRTQVADVVCERERLRAVLSTFPGVRRVYPSAANFLLLRLRDAEATLASLRDAGIVARDMRALPQLGDALRVTVGMPPQNDRVIEALRLAEREIA